MRAALVEKYGGPERLVLKEWPDPRPAAEQVLIRTRFIGLNFADLMQRAGVYPRTPKPPFIPGLELAGEVEAVGERVSHLKAGDRVAAYPIFGSHAPFVATDLAAKIPDTMTFEEAAALGVGGMTAHYAVNYLGKARAGETILITAAAGGVGTLAVQIAKLFGLKVVALAGGPEKCDLARALGADAAINTREKNWKAEISRLDFDIALDSVGGSVMRTAWKRLKPMGRYILFGFAGAVGPGAFSYVKGALNYFRTPFHHPLHFVSTNRTLSGFNLSLITQQRHLLMQILMEVFDLWEKGDLKPVISKIHPFADIARAHADMQARRTMGKVLIRVNG
jgi:NADPH:quinone reductase-like Zn-dependent oxidoreductase